MPIRIMDLGDKIAQNLERIIADKETNNRAVAEAANLGHTAVRDIILRKTKNPTYATLVKIAEVLGVPVSDITGDQALERPTIAVAGKVGAGAKVPMVDAYEKGDGLFSVICPPQLSPRGVVAVEIEGDSMVPMYQPGHILFFSRANPEGILEEDIGQPCVIEDDQGMVWVKLLKRGEGSGLWNLISLNLNAENKIGVGVKWAARVRLALPADLVERV